MQLSILIPAMNEGEGIRKTIDGILAHLNPAGVVFEVIVIHGRSKDQTEAILQEISATFEQVNYCNETAPYGFGHAIQKGLTMARGEFVTIFMADGSDSPEDLIRYLETAAEKECDAVFGSRFIKGGEVLDYPQMKLIMNRIFNLGLSILFCNRFNDYTNAFKLYRRSFLERLGPFSSGGFEITTELPLKSIRNYARYRVIPISWQGSDKVSALNISNNLQSYLKTAFRCRFGKKVAIEVSH